MPQPPIGVIFSNLKLLAKAAQFELDMDRLLRGGLLEAAQHVEGHIKIKVFELLDSTTGNLARSYSAVPLFKEVKSWSTGVYSDLIYAAIQDQGTKILPGGAIFPKTVKMLAIPVSDYVKKKVGLWPRDWPTGRLQLIISKKKNAILAEVSGKKITPHYVLKSYVKFEGVHYLEAAREAAAPGVRKILGDKVSAAVEKRYGR